MSAKALGKLRQRVSLYAVKLRTLWVDRGNWAAIAKQADYDPAKLAALIGIGERSLQRACSLKLGYAPQEWLERHRIEEAMARLLRGEGIKETAQALGFRHVSALSREFQKRRGMSPSEFVLRNVRRTGRDGARATCLT